MTPHTHTYTRSTPTATVETCPCGRFRHTELAGPAIIEQRAPAHTPGPWTALLGNGKPGRTVYAHGEIVASCTEKADARLIAAAPALLDALRDMVCKPCETADGTPHPWCDRARALLRAVEGG